YPIPELNSTGYEFYHLKSGAKVVHFFNSDPNNLFSIAFRTPVNDNTGVAHILEHSVLCGSKRYPVKDPFQEMMKGSLHTFLNALTYPDKTVYPVSSQVEKDFFNLVSVYADAVFNPILSENTFYQEGWHFEVTDLNKPIDIKGIVYNEMKGVYSNFSSQVERKLLSTLFPDTNYHFESGGDPEHIPELTYEDFIAFHRRYYHPSNSFIVLYGNIPSQKTLAFLDENFLNLYTKISLDSAVKMQKLWKKPRNFFTEAPASKEEDGSATVVLSWIFGDATDPVNTLAGRILSWYLLDTETSPLKRALLDSGLGEDLADVSGFDADLRQTVFSVGLRKTKPEHTSQIEEIILSTLNKIVKDGLDRDLLLGAIRTIEFDLREVSGIHFPYNLRIAERCYRSWIYDGDPFAHCAFERPLNIIKEHFENNIGFFENFLRATLLDNTHRLTSTIVASSEAAKKLEELTKKQVEKLTSSFGIKDKKRYFELTQTLLEYQKTPSNKEDIKNCPAFLLKISLSKVKQSQLR
ncbi:MAG: insulinase family protein, partial [Chitinispirillaceae bacterium]|nr:insulinase family protein [Chitinispirillaceae bacterium]